jgi:hypothetical protein
LSCRCLGPLGFTHLHEAFAENAHGVDVARRGILQPGAGGLDEVHDNVIDHAPHDLVHQPAARDAGVALCHVGQLSPEDRQIAQ